MSHITKVGGVAIKDVNAMKSAVQELNEKGIKCSLVENSTVRMHSTRETQAVGNCEYVLKLNGQYDVGFKKQADGSYEPVMDTYGNHVGNQIGAKGAAPRHGAELAQHQMGQFLQPYAKHAAMNAARAKGYMVQGCVTDAQGRMQLTIGGFH